MDDKDLKRMEQLEAAEYAIDDALDSSKVGRAEITQEAQRGASDSLAKINEAMESDELADEARRLSIIAERSGGREQRKEARQKERAARRQARQKHREATKSARQTYHAIKFSEPGKLGLMRLVQVVFAAHIALSLVMLLFTSRDDYAYGLANISNWLLVVLEGMAFWAFVNRYKIARYLVIVVAIVTLAVDAFTGFASKSLSFASFVKDGLFYLLLIAYFLFSERVRLTLVNDLSVRRSSLPDPHAQIARKGWPLVRNLVIYFILFSILGHWMEMAMCQLIRLGLVEGEYDPTNTMLWRDWLYPFPMEGAAVVIIALLLHPLYEWLKRKTGNQVIAHVLSFVANALACSLIEFSMGLIVNANHELWDYSENFGNVMGQVCLQNALAFGAACSVITWFVYPTLERWIARQPYDYMNVAFVATLLFGCIIWSLYIVESPELQEGTIASGSYTSSSGKTEASYTITGEQDGDSDTSGGLTITVDREKDPKESLESLEKGAQELRETLLTDDSLSAEQREDVEAQLDAVEQSLQSLEDTLNQ